MKNKTRESVTISQEDVGQLPDGALEEVKAPQPVSSIFSIVVTVAPTDKDGDVEGAAEQARLHLKSVIDTWGIHSHGCHVTARIA